jgi:hypothetical protein
VRQPEELADTSWNDPLWYAVRMVVDELRGRVPKSEEGILEALTKQETDAASGLKRHLLKDTDLLSDVWWYVQFRDYAGTQLLEQARNEKQALEDFHDLSSEVVKTYGTRSVDHHQSPKVIVSTIEVLTKAICEEQGLDVNVDPQKRASLISDDYLWTSPRRLDGALPSLLNPVGLWEIKEYWGGTSGGSKMSDAIYECQLVGQELRTFSDSGGPYVHHYAILDGAQQWKARRSDLRRAVDLVCSGLLDELLVGEEILSEWPRIVRELCDLVPR